jgi:hypothetical protein
MMVGDGHYRTHLRHHSPGTAPLVTLPRPPYSRIRGTDRPIYVGYVDDQGNEVSLADVAMIPADSPQG